MDTFKQKIPKHYNGSAKFYIDKHIIPTLPTSYKIITLTQSLYKYLILDSNIRYIRKLKGYDLRGNLYNHNKVFTVTDNEPALWIYLECYENNVKDFNHYNNTGAFPVGFALTSSEKKHFNPQFNFGKQLREKKFSAEGIKHCHILQCSPRNTDFNQLSVDKRMLRLLSPINHFPFPSPKKYNMDTKTGDYGEEERFIRLVKQRLYKFFYKKNNDKIFFMKYLEKAGSTDFDFNDAKDFNLSFNLKASGVGKIAVNKNITNSKYFKLEKNFVLKKSYYGNNHTIRFIDSNNKTIEYNHDSLLNQLNKRITDLPCWKKYGYYTNSKQLPRFVEGLETVKHI